MKTIIYIILFCSIGLSLQAQPNKGGLVPGQYFFDKEEVVFEFNKAALMQAYHDNTVRLDFPEFDWNYIFNLKDVNTWSQEGWYLRKKDKETYQLRKKITDFQDKFQDAYKFIILNKDKELDNDSTYQTPSSPQKSSVVNFYLKGYRQNSKVILSGSFNSWNEEAYAMHYNAATDTWSIDINLKPGKYEYKFIVDGTWMEDPENLNHRTNEHNTENSVVIVQANGEPFFQRPAAATSPVPVDISTKSSHITPDAAGNVRFSLKGFDGAHKVILAGSFNDWDEQALVCKREGELWIFDMKLKPGRYEYKFIVDGNWMHDPDNTESVENEVGSLNSVVHVCKMVHFFLAGYTDAQSVLLAGSFNNWEPKGIPMARRADGWHLDYPLDGGKQTYKFIVDGNWIIDPANRKKETSWEGYVNSVIFVR